MHKQYILSALLVCEALFVSESVQQTPAESAVVEYHVSFVGATADEQLAHRVSEYVDYIGRAAAESADIVVFPEATLTTYDQAQLVPDPADLLVPCDTDAYAGTALASLSCAARNGSLYVVINLTMRRRNDGKDSLFNTNVVLDRSGTVISIYRKVNLYGEPAISTTAEPDLSTFTTDFGVEFGHFICFDLLFETPANVLVRRGVLNFAFPTMWFAELPFLSGVQAQQGWAFDNNVNVLAAGYNNATVGSSGSGIYAGRAGAHRSRMSDAPQSQLLVSTIKKVPPPAGEHVSPPASEESVVNIVSKRDITGYHYLPMMMDGSQQASSLTVDGYRCGYSYSVRADQPLAGQLSYTYRIAMYNGIKSYDGFANSRLRVCAVVACTDDTDTTTCGRTFPAGTSVQRRYTFTGLEISGTFASTLDQKNLVMPSTLTTGLLPINSDEFTYKAAIDATSTNVTMRLTKSKDLLTFGVYSVDFSGSVGLSVSGVLLGVSIVCAWF